LEEHFNHRIPTPCLKIQTGGYNSNTCTILYDLLYESLHSPP